ncbi:hypothetical protein VE04_05097 [Pseudogymnoascus sp. 24MN13]|nr:hypothetical protein VE04_05097 [Pseudogymnoascus sp. 24MN13]
MSEEELKTYHGSCHCGNFAFTVTVPEIKSGARCNCSLCHRKGYFWLKIGSEQFKADEGTGELACYQVSGGCNRHLFCATCGTGVMAEKPGEPFMVVNLNTVKDLDRKALEVKAFDGASIGEPYKTFDVPTDIIDALDLPGYKTYTGHCHCGDVKVAFKSPDLYDPNTFVVSDNCSICTIHAYVIAYPERNHYQITGTENTTAYFMGDKWIAHRFCKRCGTPVNLDTQTGPPAHVLAKIPEFYHPRLKAYPTNLRVINGLDWKELGINYLAPGEGADAN